jgi:hypothetical protein
LAEISAAEALTARESHISALSEERYTRIRNCLKASPYVSSASLHVPVNVGVVVVIVPEGVDALATGARFA